MYNFDKPNKLDVIIEDALSIQKLESRMEMTQAASVSCVIVVL